MVDKLKAISEPYKINDDFSNFYNGLIACDNVKNVELYSYTKDSVIVRLELKINLPCRKTTMDVDIKSIEPIDFICYTREIRYKAPVVFSRRLDFPLEKLPHTVALCKGLTYICLHRGSIDDWYIEHSVEDFINRIRNWFSDAASGNLIRLGDDFEPMILYRETGNAVFSYDMLTEFIEAYWRENKGKSGFAYTLCCVNNREESKSLDMDKNSFSVQILDIVKRKKLGSFLLQYNKKLTQKNSRYFVGIVVWSTESSRYSEYFRLITMELEELYAFNEKLGNEFKRALKILKDRNIPDKFLLISAINRPTKVIGFNKNIEFVNYIFKIKKITNAHTTKIEGDGRALALSHLEPLSRRLAADISTLASEKNPKILFVGAGALGSKVIFHLARNGYTNITIIDEDILSPHNLVRHALFSDSISRNKAEDIANKLNNMYILDKDRYFKAFPVSFINYAENNGLSQYDVLIDCSASKSVFSFLGNYTGKLPSVVIRAELANKGKLGLIIKEGVDRVPKVDDIEASLFNYARSNNEVSDWLKRFKKLKYNLEDGQFEDITIGLGCNTNTMRLSDNIISYHAAVFSSYIKRTLINENGEGQFLISYFNEDNLSKNYCRTVSLQDFITVSSSDNEWTTKVYRKTYECILSELNKCKPNEAGGILLGKANIEDKVIYVTDIYIPKDSERWPYLFAKGTEGTKEHLKNINDITGDMIYYVGDWHTHPEHSTNMSCTDRNSLIELHELLKKYSYPAHIMIFNEKEVSSYVMN